MIGIFLIMIRSGSSWAHYGNMQYVYAYRSRSEAKGDLEVVRKQFGKRGVKLMKFTSEVAK